MGWSGALRTVVDSLYTLVEHRLKETRIDDALPPNHVCHSATGILSYSMILTENQQLDCVQWIVDSSRGKERSVTKIVQLVVGFVFASAHQMPMVGNPNSPVYERSY